MANLGRWTLRHRVANFRLVDFLQSRLISQLQILVPVDKMAAVEDRFWHYILPNESLELCGGSPCEDLLISLQL